MAFAYGVGGTVLGVRVATLAAQGQLSTGAALGGAAVAAGALVNGYLIQKYIAN